MKTLILVGRSIDGIVEITTSPIWWRVSAAERERLADILENAAFWSEYGEFVEANDFNQLDESTGTHAECVAWIIGGGND